MRRLIGLLVGLLVVATACSSGSTSDRLADEQEGGSYGSGVSLDFDDDKGRQPTGQRQGGQQQGGQQQGGGQNPSQGRDVPQGNVDTFVPNPTRRPQDSGQTGENAFFYLSAQIPRMIVEIDMMEGLELQPATIELLRARLQSVMDRPGALEIITSVIPRAGRSEWTADDIWANQERFRDHDSTRDEVVLYMHVLEGEPKDSGAIGIAYSSSSTVIFLERIRNAAATPLVTAEQIERSTTVHEVGHLLSLVNMTYESPRNHEDPDHQGHSKNPDSVMYWAVDNVGIAGLLEGRTEPPTDFDADDRADLADVKAGKLG